jgi:hypothetical protein
LKSEEAEAEEDEEEPAARAAVEEGEVILLAELELVEGRMRVGFR